jgi:cyclomaltodextrinase / maltogenic alpha-amylase / neopullulanase
MVAAALVAACTGTGGGSDRASAGGDVTTFDTRGGDAWAWTEQLSGTADCSSVTVADNRDAVSAVTTSNGRFSARVPMVPGTNRVTAACGSDAAAEVTFEERLDPRPTARIHVALDGREVTLDASTSEPSAFDGSPIDAYAWSERPGNPVALGVDGSKDQVTVTAPERDGEYYVTLTITDREGRTDRSTTYFVVEHGEPRPVDLATQNAAWVDNAVVYGVVPPLFGDEGFKSVEARLPYLARLGVTAIWLSPVNVSPAGDFGYAVTDYFDLNPAYGTKQDFRELVDAAHAEGIRVLMDFVPNHISDQHPYSVDAAKYGKASHYYDFFDRDAQGAITHYFDWSNLNNLNYDNVEVRNMELAAFSYWVREFDVDGFRVDACWGVKKRRAGFWPVWREELTRIKPDLMLIAEASARDPYYFSHGFDVGYDWTDQLGQWAWQGVFDAPEVIGDWLDQALLNPPQGYDADALIFRFLNNNDTGTRFVDLYGEGLTRVAAAMLLTLPGVPELYTGDEIGASYLPYSTLAPLDWSGDRYPGLHDYYRHLIELRRTTPALHSRAWERVDVEPGGGTYAYVRTADGAPSVLVLLNFADAATTLSVALNGPLASFAGAKVTDLLSGERLDLGGPTARIHLDGTTARILELEDR